MRTDALLRAVRRLERKSAPPVLPWQSVDAEYLEAVRMKVQDAGRTGRTLSEGEWEEFRREYDRLHPGRPKREAPPAWLLDAMKAGRERVRRAMEEELHG